MIQNLSDWLATLAKVSTNQENLFCQPAPISGHRTIESLDTFRTFDFHFPKFSSLAKEGAYILFDCPSLENKSEVLDQLESICRRDSRLDNRTDRILLIADELLTNALISAKNVAAEIKLGTSQSQQAALVFEWNENEAWIHVLDQYGLFSRQNFERSFAEHSQSLHGSAGRGLKLVIMSSTDFYARSDKNKGTWIAARVELKLSNAKQDLEAKRIFLGFL